MIPPFKMPLPRSAYFRLVEHQSKLNLPAYHADIHLVLFISFTRVAAGLALVSILFPPSVHRIGVALVFMGLGTLASIAHLRVPLRFMTMVRNNKSPLVWEVRLAGALTAFLGLHFLSLLGYLQPFEAVFPWITCILALLFLISTAWAYRFETHPAWKSSVLPIYYIVSACTVGLVFRAMYYSFAGLPLVFGLLLVAEAFLLFLYGNHLRMTSPTALQHLLTGHEKRKFLAFLWATLLLPALLTLLLLVLGYNEEMNVVMAISCFAGILLERILFFQVERPVYFLSFIENPNGKDRYWVRG